MINNTPKIVAILRLKNEERWIGKVLDSASDICKAIVVLDDGSTDNTIKICKEFEQVVDIHQQSDLPFDEVRDKNILWKMTLKQKPDYVLSLDGDEIIQPHAKDLLFDELNVIYPNESIFEFQSLFVWDKPDQYRNDGVYGNIWYKRLIRMKNQQAELSFNLTGYPGNAHSTRLPSNAKGWNNPVRSKVKILHFGYYDKTLRENKFQFYNKLDPNNINFDGYLHILGKGKFSGKSGVELVQLPNELVLEI